MAVEGWLTRPWLLVANGAFLLIPEPISLRDAARRADRRAKTAARLMNANRKTTVYERGRGGKECSTEGE
jgi:hypothetical protein